MNFDEINDKDDRTIILTLLIDIGSNLIRNRHDVKHRILPDEFIREVFSQSSSAFNCLKSMGFQKIENDFVFDDRTTNETLEEIVRILEEKLVDRRTSIDENWTPIEQIEIRSNFNQKFPIRSTLKQVQSYEDRNLLEMIRKEILPLNEFNRRLDQKKFENPLDRRDALIVELLNWFKEEFFTWFDQSFCSNCSKSMKFIRFISPTEQQRIEGDAQRVELYRCETCSREDVYPRYNKISMLLKTRSGRCGEAANLFTCFCRSLSFESRYIYDPSDHVWTEVYSESQQRWIHCDACENLCDSPLIYEQGWKKQLEFCLAFAKDHLEDVTWKYVTNFSQTIQKRKLNEKQFQKFLQQINLKLQKNLDKQTKKQLNFRRIRDLVEMIRPRTLSSDVELNGRQSGSLQWRLSRQETQENNEIHLGFVYKMSEEEIDRNSLIVEYNSVQDQFYRQENRDEAKWNERWFSYSNLQRKVEKDWKMVYLARKNLFQNGFAKFQFEIDSNEKQFDHLQIFCPFHQFDQFGSVNLFVHQENQRISLFSSSSSSSPHLFEFDFPSNCSKTFQLEIVLSGTNDENDSNSWQKTQLFRQSIVSTSSDDRSHLFRFHLTLKGKSN